MKAMILVTHLLGTGHLSRALTLARAFADHGHDILVVSGGMPAPQLNAAGLPVLGLPPLRSDGTDFTRLLVQSGHVADADYLEARITAMVEAIRRFQPQVLITELFPFGRRILATEFKAALRAARALASPPVILVSIRDILAPPSNSVKVDRTERVVAEFYDGVLVHSNPAITTLDVSWPVSQGLQKHLHYTGYVAPPPPDPHPDGLGRDEILVSAGGGPVGRPIFRAAIEAARKMPNRRWRLLVGGRDAQRQIDELRNMATDVPVKVEPVRPDFRQMLPLAAASVSMCGYNTALDLLQSGTRAVLIPFDDGQEVEQSLRGQSLAQLPGIELLGSSGLSGSSLAAALTRLMETTPRQPATQGFDGATRSVEIAQNLLEASR